MFATQIQRNVLFEEVSFVVARVKLSASVSDAANLPGQH